MTMLPSERAKLASSTRTASRYELPGKAGGSEIAFGIDRTFGRYFQFWPDPDEPSVDEDRLSQAEIGALLKKYGKPSRKLELAISAFMMDLDPGDHGLRGIRASKEKGARFHEGPEGTKEFEVWKKKQGPEFEEEWNTMNAEYGDKFKTADLEELGLYDAFEEEAMFAKGEHVPLGDLPEELQENVENPPPAVEKLKEEMEEEAMHEKFDEAMLPVEVVRMKAARQRLSWASREAAGGLYGYTKKTQTDVETTVRKAQKKAASLAKSIYAQDEGVATFLQTHSKRGKSTTAKLLISAMKALGPKFASEKEASDRNAGGLYGHPAKTARLGLSACSELRAFVGEIASDLHARRTARYAKITGFLGEHSKKARCPYSRMLLGCYPEVSDQKTAGCEKMDEGPMRENCEKRVEEGKKKEEGAKDKKASDFDAEEIGETESGALESETDETYMSTFNQEEFSELQDKEEAGELSDGKADDLLKKAFVPDSVDGWIEWEDGTKAASPRAAFRRGVAREKRADDWKGSESTKVQVSVDSRRSTVWKGTLSVAEARRLEDLINRLYQLFDEYDGGNYQDWQEYQGIEDQIKELQERKKNFERKHGKTLAEAKKLGVLDYYMKGGDAQTPVTFKDSEGNVFAFEDNTIVAW
jgi:hypothetical protein